MESIVYRRTDQEKRLITESNFCQGDNTDHYTNNNIKAFTTQQQDVH